ncbi:phage holin family protein [Geobacter sp. DSM 9736]|uniref:phage holin family protein n=1 Tax=Geobacter sp. DSM 9736 TaxID=1277350 RepID=UPI000B4FD61D|nr:phage holin family protein [Geobacter sp. DSM 9736]SNB46541.1 putative membrane protein [Geobacter sp. DSM 9736]
MREFLLKWLSNAIALLAVAYILPGVSVERWLSLLVAALVIGLLNAFLRPILIFLTLPVNLLTLGLFTLVINGFMFYLAAWLVKGFQVSGFLSAFVAALLFSIISFLLNLLIVRK